LTVASADSGACWSIVRRTGGPGAGADKAEPGSGSDGMTRGAGRRRRREFKARCLVLAVLSLSSSC